MNKLIIFASIIVLIVCCNLGVSSMRSTQQTKQEALILQQQNNALKNELRDKERFKRHAPKLLVESYQNFINQLRFLQIYTESKVDLLLLDGKAKNGLGSLVTPTEYRGVNGIELPIKMQQINNGSKLIVALDLLHQLERKTDYLIKEVIKENDDLIIRGTLYGIN